MRAVRLIPSGHPRGLPLYACATGYTRRHMGLFGKKVTNVALVDIHSSSIGAAYVTYPVEGPPTMVYSVRVPLETHATEPLMEALTRTLALALSQLITEGAPVLRTHSGSGHVDSVMAAVAAPWQTSQVVSRVVEHDKPFLFTKLVLDAAIKKEPVVAAEGMTRVNDLLIATLLNGYEIGNPFGKRAKRAELILLSSSISTDVMELTTRAIRKALHQHTVSIQAFLPEAYVAMRDLYPQQRDFLMLDVGGEATDILVAKHGLLVSLLGVGHGVNEISRATRAGGVSSPTVPVEASVNLINENRNTSFASKVEEAERAWLGEMQAALADVAKQEPLPRTIFLLADESVREFLHRLLDVPQLRTLWLTEEALAILPIASEQFIPFFAAENADGLDASLALLALAARDRLA